MADDDEHDGSDQRDDEGIGERPENKWLHKHEHPDSAISMVATISHGPRRNRIKPVRNSLICAPLRM